MDVERITEDIDKYRFIVTEMIEKQQIQEFLGRLNSELQRYNNEIKNSKNDGLEEDQIDKLCTNYCLLIKKELQNFICDTTVRCQQVILYHIFRHSKRDIIIRKTRQYFYEFDFPNQIEFIKCRDDGEMEKHDIPQLIENKNLICFQINYISKMISQNQYSVEHYKKLQDTSKKLDEYKVDNKWTDEQIKLIEQLEKEIIINQFEFAELLGAHYITQNFMQQNILWRVELAQYYLEMFVNNDDPMIQKIDKKIIQLFLNMNMNEIIEKINNDIIDDQVIKLCFYSTLTQNICFVKSVFNKKYEHINGKLCSCSYINNQEFHIDTHLYYQQSEYKNEFTCAHLSHNYYKKINQTEICQSSIRLTEQQFKQIFEESD